MPCRFGWGWIEANGISSRGTPIAHLDILKQLHEILDDMEYGDDGGVGVNFWHVPREKNVEADALANQALDTGN